MHDQDSDFLRMMLTASPAGFCVVDGSEFKVKWLNDAYRAFLDPPWNRKDITGHSLNELPGFTDAGLDSIFRAVATTRRTYHNPEFVYTGFDRGTTYWNWTLSALPGNEEPPDLLIQAVEITSQVTARKTLEAHIGETQKKLRLYETILANTPDLVYVFDLNHRFVYANRVLLQMWGKTWEEAIGRNCLELGYEPWHAEMHDRELEQVKATKKPIRGDVPFNGTFGRRIYDYIFVPVIGPGGEVEAIAGTTRDVTERNQAEEELRVARAELEQKVEERTHELLESNQQLLEAKALADRASKAKSDILSNTSHELRTPLNSVLLLSQMLAENWEGNLTTKQKQFADMIHDSGQELLALVNDLLDLAQIESGTPLQLDIHRVDWGRLSDHLAASFNELAKQKLLAFDMHFPADLPANFRTDERRLLQILKNLLSNAFKFTREGSVALQVSCDAENDYLQFAVTDTGLGIEEDKLQLIFEAFQQANPGTSRTYGGTGLGLSISRELAHLMNGNITVTSQLGRGSTFVLSLPLPSSEFVDI